MAGGECCQMYTDCEAMKRQSNVLLATAASDARLTQALMQIEQLTIELETVKQDHKEKVNICICLRRSTGAVSHVAGHNGPLLFLFGPQASNMF